jgi:hypothetical protein
MQVAQTARYAADRKDEERCLRGIFLARFPVCGKSMARTRTQSVENKFAPIGSRVAY